MSTVSPVVSRELAARARETGAQMVDAPVSGSVLTLEQGKLSIMVGGDRSTFDRLRPLLEDIGPKVTYVGANGLAVSMKIAMNISVAVQMLAFAEGVLLAERSGIARETAVEVMTHSAIASPMLQYRGPFVLQMPDEAWFDTTMMQKDVQLALDMGHDLRVPLPTTSTTNEWLTAARAMGLSDADFAAVFRALARAAGVER
jgi:3-hydroxyisobutyrate dehydrogenase-like beta-hydroxyacid dehydrogenase